MNKKYRNTAFLFWTRIWVMSNNFFKECSLFYKLSNVTISRKCKPIVKNIIWHSPSNNARWDGEYVRFARSGGTATIVQTVDIAHNQWKRTRLCVRWYFRTIFALLIFRCLLYPDILQRLLCWIFADIWWISHNFPFSAWGVNTCCWS